MGGSGPSRVVKFLYAPEGPEQGDLVPLCTCSPAPTIWALKPPSWALVHKITYAPVIYTALCIIFWMRAYPLLGQVEGGWALEILSFFSISRDKPPPTCPRKGYARIQNIMRRDV